MDLKKIIWKLLWTCIELDVWVGTLVLKWAGAIPMPAWCSTSDGQAAKGEIEREMKTRGWDLLSRASSKDQLDIGLDQRRKFITHLQCQYPDAHKDTAAWQKFISKLTGQAKQWKSASTAYTQASNQTHNPTKNLALSDSRLKRKAGAGLSRHDCVCCRVNWRGFCTASACCVEDGCVLSYQRGGGFALRVRVVWRTVSWGYMSRSYISHLVCPKPLIQGFGQTRCEIYDRDM